MANRRMIYESFFEDEYFGMVDIKMRLMWIGLIVVLADDQGRCLDNSSLIKAKIFIYDRDINEQSIDEYLELMAQDNKIVRYKAGGNRLLQIVKWWQYQTPAWASPSRFRPPPGWVDRVRCNVANSTGKGSTSILIENWNLRGGFPDEVETAPHTAPHTVPHTAPPTHPRIKVDKAQGTSQGGDINKLSKDKLKEDNINIFNGNKEDPEYVLNRLIENFSIDASVENKKIISMLDKCAADIVDNKFILITQDEEDHQWMVSRLTSVVSNILPGIVGNKMDVGFELIGS